MSTQHTPEELKAKALALYKPPFKFECGYIFDADHNMVADEADAASMVNALRIRGWGRIGYMENHEALQDAVGELIAEALTEYWKRDKAATEAAEIQQLRRLADEYDAMPDDGHFEDPHPIFQMAADVDRLNAENAALKQQRDELLNALLKYGEHRAHPKLCEMYRNPKNKVCTCGLDEAIAKARGQV